MRATATPREVIEQRWAEKRPPEPAKPPPAPLNVREVLDLGSLVYFEFRGRPYGVPPLPYRAGQRLVSLWFEVARMGATISDDNRRAYDRALAQIVRLMWRHTRPVGILMRALRRLGLLRNPFKLASEAEIAELVGFFLRARTKPTGRVRAVADPPFARI